MATAGRLLNDFETQEPVSTAYTDSVTSLLPSRTEVPVTWRSFQRQDEEFMKDPIRSGVPEPGLEPMYGDELLLAGPAMYAAGELMSLTPRLLANSALRGGAARTAGERLMESPVGRTVMRRFANTPVGRETAERIYAGIPVVEKQGALNSGGAATSSTVADVLGKVPEPIFGVKMLQPPQYNEMVRYGVDPEFAKDAWRAWDSVVNENFRSNTFKEGIPDTRIPEYREPSNEWVARAELGLRQRFDYEGKNPIFEFQYGGTSGRGTAAYYMPATNTIGYTPYGVFQPTDEYNNTWRHEFGHHIAMSDATRNEHSLTMQDYINVILPNEMPDEFIRRPDIGKLSHGEALVEYWKEQGLIDDPMYKHIQDKRIPQKWNADHIRGEIPSTLAEADTIPYAIGKNLIELSAPLTVEGVRHNLRVGKDRLWSGEAKMPNPGLGHNRRYIEYQEKPVGNNIGYREPPIPRGRGTAQGFVDKHNRIAKYDAAQLAKNEPWRFETREWVQKARDMYEKGDRDWLKYAPDAISDFYINYDEEDRGYLDKMVREMFDSYLK